MRASWSWSRTPCRRLAAALRRSLLEVCRIRSQFAKNAASVATFSDAISDPVSAFHAAAAIAAINTTAYTTTMCSSSSSAAAAAATAAAAAAIAVQPK